MHKKRRELRWRRGTQGLLGHIYGVGFGRGFRAAAVVGRAGDDSDRVCELVDRISQRLDRLKPSVRIASASLIPVLTSASRRFDAMMPRAPAPRRASYGAQIATG